MSKHYSNGRMVLAAAMAGIAMVWVPAAAARDVELARDGVARAVIVAPSGWTNDLALLRSPDEVVANYARILDRIAGDSPKTRVYIQSILPTDDALHTTRKNGDIWQINRELEAMARERGLVYIDLFSHFAGPDGRLDTAYSLDGLHLNGAGYLLWKELIEKKIHR